MSALISVARQEKKKTTGIGIEPTHSALVIEQGNPFFNRRPTCSKANITRSKAQIYMALVNSDLKAS